MPVNSLQLPRVSPDQQLLPQLLPVLLLLLKQLLLVVLALTPRLPVQRPLHRPEQLGRLHDVGPERVRLAVAIPEHPVRNHLVRDVSHLFFINDS